MPAPVSVFTTNIFKPADLRQLHTAVALIESAWNYRFPARKTKHLMRKASAAPPAVQAIAWAAQKRLCARYRHLYHAGKAMCVVTTAVARELAQRPGGRWSGLPGAREWPCDDGRRWP